MTDKEIIEKYVVASKRDEAFKLLDSGYPVQYIVGNVEFLDLVIDVNECVLIPRFETEYLVEKTIKYAKKMFLNKPLKIADLGTGSGVIAISLAKYLSASVDAYDISQSALIVAGKNALKNGVKINIYEHDILKPINGKYDIIISNPPYIAYDEKISSIVYDYEPHIALFADHEGLLFYKKILSYIKNNLNSQYIIAFEIGESQGQALMALAKKEFPNSVITIENDLTNRNRYLFIKSE